MNSYLEHLVIVFCLVAAMFLFVVSLHAEGAAERKAHQRGAAVHKP